MKVALVVLIISVLFALQAARDGDVFQPPRKGLVAVHFPDLTNAEESVREQVKGLQNSLVTAARRD